MAADVERVPEHQTFLEEDLHRAQFKLKDTELKLEEIASQQSRWEHEMLMLRQQLQISATRDMKFGIHQSVETLHIEAELASVQQKSAKLTAKRTELINEMQKWSPNLEVSSNGSSDNNKKIQQQVCTKYGNLEKFSYSEIFLIFFFISQQPKTVRMVKRDSKDRLKEGKFWNEADQTSSPPPPTLPRGNTQNVHNFLKDDDDYNNDLMEEKSEKSQLSKSSTLPRSFKSEDLKDLRTNGGPVYSGLVKPSMIHGTKFNIGYRKKV